ncbi:DUF5610 domain-containing protein [Massilia sp. TS11]|uniref:DUF5610 domain-containing protein n=1 Tax=Massilia sp. TS11 TaxID=2908003 RepID=UPI001EDB033F|nr:DUF5610 domain-containing protein [Massilia sp. TS11]MCG2585727.1 DUF5610 domain-containing protein [Massilia sp. TS11]
MSLPVSAPAAAAFQLQDAAGPTPLPPAAAAAPRAPADSAPSNVSLTTGGEPLALVFKTAVDGMSAQLGGQTSTAVVAQDANPVLTSARILAMSVAFYQSFRQQHLGESEEAVLQAFMQAIHRGIDSGFGEARQVLSGMQALDAPAAATLDTTYHLVRQGLDRFAREASPPRLAA